MIPRDLLPDLDQLAYAPALRKCIDNTGVDLMWDAANQTWNMQVTVMAVLLPAVFAIVGLLGLFGPRLFAPKAAEQRTAEQPMSKVSVAANR